MSVIGWIGIVWLSLSTLLSLNGLRVNMARGYKALILSKDATMRSVAVVVLDALAIFAVMLSANVYGAPILAALALMLTVPFVLDIKTAYTDILDTGKLHAVTRSVVLLARLGIVFVLMFA